MISTHISFFMSIPALIEPLSIVYRSIEQRVSSYQQVSNLRSRTQFVLIQSKRPQLKSSWPKTFHISDQELTNQSDSQNIRVNHDSQMSEDGTESLEGDWDLSKSSSSGDPSGDDDSSSSET